MSTETVKRGFWLSAWLILVVTFNVIAMLVSCNAMTAPTHYSRGTGLSAGSYQMYAAMMTLLNFANIVGASAIWNGKNGASGFLPHLLLSLL